MNASIFRRPAVVVVFAAAFFCLLSSGCLVSSTNNETRSGKYVADSTFDQIKPGETSAAWVKATLGEPSDKTTVEGQGNAEVWKYTYTEKKEGSGAIFLIFGGTSSKEKSGTAFVELKDGVVTNKWRG
jgi:outer membrane protein assembly factor BamE (lipoprotein component of BamABCDE complex)